MVNIDELWKQAQEIENRLAEQGVALPPRCKSCTIKLENNRTMFCKECEDIIKEELSQGNVYLGGNAKRRSTARYHL